MSNKSGVTEAITFKPPNGNSFVCSLLKKKKSFIILKSKKSEHLEIAEISKNLLFFMQLYFKESMQFH